MSIIGRKKSVIAGARGKTMTPKNKTKEELIKDIRLLQKRIAEFETVDTQRTQATETLRDSEVRYRRLFESAAIDGVMILDAETGMVVNVNPFLVKLLGFSREQFTKKKIWELGFLKDVFASQANFLELQQKGSIHYDGLPMETADGRQIDVEFVGNVYEVDNQKMVQCRIRDITERKQVEDALQAKNVELTDLIHSVSHDLKSPLVTIQTFLGYLEQDTRNSDAPRIEKDFEYIRNAADKMSLLLDELLELSRVGRIVNSSEETSLQLIVQEALLLVAGRITQQGVQVKVTEKPIMLYGDRIRLVEVFQNLIDNAVKFMGNQSKPCVEIGAEQAGNKTVLFVRDNGIGIDPRHQPKLFNLFEKLDLNIEGTGIGLTLVKRIVELHGGKIWVESEGRPGKGATFRFTLAKTRQLKT